jgi:hypothetical protein
MPTTPLASLFAVKLPADFVVSSSVGRALALLVCEWSCAVAVEFRFPMTPGFL